MNTVPPLSRAMRDFVLVVIGCGITTALFSLLFWYFGSQYLDNPTERLSDQALAGYIGVLFGTAVALGGSIVAIRLAHQALSLSVDQTRLQDLSNNIAGRQTPDGVMAAEAAASYRQFKRLVTTLPSLMRRASRTPRTDDHGTQPHPFMAPDAVGPCFEFMEAAIRSFLDSHAPSTLVSIATSVNAAPGGKPWRLGIRPVEHYESGLGGLWFEVRALRTQLDATGELDDTLLPARFGRLVHAFLGLVGDFDRLILTAAAETDSLDDRDDRFVRLTLPVASTPAGPLLESAVERFRSWATGQRMQDEVTEVPHPAHWLTKRRRKDPPLRHGLMFALHESNSLDAVDLLCERLRNENHTPSVIRYGNPDWSAQLRSLGADKSAVVVVSDALSVALEDIHEVLVRLSLGDELADGNSVEDGDDVLAQAPTVPPFRNAGIWVLLDDVGRARDSHSDPLNRTGLTMFEAVNCWMLFRAVRDVIRAMVQIWPFDERRGTEPDEDALHMIRQVANPWVRQTLAGGAPEGFPTRSDKIDDVIAMIAAAATTLAQAGEPAGEEWAMSMLAQCNRILKHMADPDRNPALLKAGLRGWYNDDGSPTLAREVLTHLCEPPITARPLYGYKNRYARPETPADLSGVNVMAIAYYDDHFRIDPNPLLRVFSASGPSYHLF